MAVPYILFPAILIPVLIINTKCHTANNNSDVIVINSGHADAVDRPEPKPKTIDKHNINIMVPVSIITTEAETDATEDVVFIPNEREVHGNDDKMKIDDILYKKTVADIINNQNVRIETEAPHEDIVFISGKNDENVEVSKIEHRKERISQKETRKKTSFNCTDLECNNTVKSVCGVKRDNGQFKHRLFLNDCYYRKVNCNFRYEENRYRKVDLEECKNIGSHNTERPYSFTAIPLPSANPLPLIQETKENFRRSSSFRRSLSMGIDGNFCSHSCPTSCPEDYDPECAVSGSGHRRVFVNHCKMDFNSCFYNVMWHRRPLSECVGGKKADMRQNRGFISWMQRVGIVDKKGRLVLS